MKISYDDIEERLLQPRFLMLLDTGRDQYVALRVVRQSLMQIYYDFVNDAPGFLPLAPVNGTAVSGQTQPFISQHNAVNISELSISDALAIPKPRTSNMLQIFYGIAPSYCFVTPEQPGGTPNAQLPETAGFPQSNYPYIASHSGYDSPLYEPSKYTELFGIADVTIQFTLANTVSIPISPKMLFVINNMLVEPIDSLDLFRKMLEGTVPRRVVSVGQIYTNIQFSGATYGGISPVSARDVMSPNGKNALVRAGYRV